MQGLPSGVGKWVPASAGKAKAGMVHSVSGWTRGVQVKLWDPLRTRAIPERLRGVITTRRYTNTHLPLPLQGRINHSGPIPTYSGGGPFSHTSSQDFLWRCTFSPKKGWRPFLVVVVTFKPTLNVQTSKQRGKNLAVDRGPPPMVQPAQWLIRPW